jgi:hypothetical protein
MKRIAVLSFVGVLLLGTAVSQTSAASQTNASASQSTSVSADKSGARVNSKSSAQTAQAADVSNKGAEAAAAGQLKSGSSIHATLQKPVDARKNKPGDQVVAKTSEDVKSEGKVIIPRGSKIVGHVTEVKAREKGKAESAVGIVFDHAVLKDGSHMPLSLAVQAVGSGATAAQAEDDSLMASGNTAVTGSVNGAASSMSRTEGGIVGGVGSTAGGLVNTAGNVGGASVNTATGAGAGAGASSSLNSNSQGVVGLRGLSLAWSASGSNSGTFTSRNSNVHLDSGTQMILRVQN